MFLIAISTMDWLHEARIYIFGIYTGVVGDGSG
jgi:hypothetical protein